MSAFNRFPKMSAEEAVAQIHHGATVAFSGFTPAGAAKAVPRAIAARALELHGQGKPFKIRMLTGASCGDSIDEALSKAQAIAWRALTIIERCAHPAYRLYLRQYIEKSRLGHIRHDLGKCFELHRNFMEYGAMLPDLASSAFGGS